MFFRCFLLINVELYLSFSDNLTQCQLTFYSYHETILLKIFRISV